MTDTIRGLLKRSDCASDALEKETIAEKPIWKKLTFHHLGLILSATFGAIAVVVAFFLIMKHANHYLKPYEQKHIIRILVMIPIYAVVSFLSYLNYRHAIYFELIRDCYEAFAISSFFTLLCHYIAPDLHEQKAYFRGVTPKNWVWPVNWMQKCTGGEDKGWLRKPQSGLTWFNVIWISVFQYCLIRPFFTVVAVITQSQGRYCASSKNPKYAYIWVAGFEAVSVTIAMYCLIQFYIQLKQDLAHHSPFLKVLCIKLVIFFCFWQSWIISLLTAEGGPLKATDTIAGPDLRIGIPSMMTCVEMAIFAVLHLWAFPWKPYDFSRRHEPLRQGTGPVARETPKTYVYGPFRALLSALNPWDIVKACSRGFRWLFYGHRHRKQDPSYQNKLVSMTPNDTSYHSQAFAENGEANLSSANPGRKNKKDGFDESDTSGLLRNAQANPYHMQEMDSYTGTHGYMNPDSLPAAPLPGQEYHVSSAPQQNGYTDFESQQMSHQGPPERQAPPGQYFGGSGRPSADWDMFAGARPGEIAPGKGPGASYDRF
ncbi:unnamed protein product [Periconia digitata]|uniref:DUF300-domain-containing protein n=1 Tax=Periconia digitata TaxID=1303443 RepID=A0A9W4UJR3_9PLEO|nr:unnamed protein product [Periconia digitata]